MSHCKEKVARVPMFKELVRLAGGADGTPTPEG
jgi:hypothetical protein